MPSTSATAAASTKSMFDEQYALSSSSSQFFMKMATTSWPWRLSSHALTAESTPPDRPTTMRCFTIARLSGRRRRPVPQGAARQAGAARRYSDLCVPSHSGFFALCLQPQK
jgi:hypothetical protein